MSYWWKIKDDLDNVQMEGRFVGTLWCRILTILRLGRCFVIQDLTFPQPTPTFAPRRFASACGRHRNAAKARSSRLGRQGPASAVAQAGFFVAADLKHSLQGGIQMLLKRAPPHGDAVRLGRPHARLRFVRGTCPFTSLSPSLHPAAGCAFGMLPGTATTAPAPQSSNGSLCLATEIK